MAGSASPTPRWKTIFLSASISAAVVIAIFGFLYMQALQAVPPHFDFLASMKSALHSPTSLMEGLVDKDGDLVADVPEDAAELIDPETLEFEVLGSDLQREQEQWSDFIAHLQKVTGKNVNLQLRGVALTDYSPPAVRQAQDFRDGKVHVACLNTGAVTLCVNAGGAIPFCVMADKDGKFGYSMELIVPKDSPAKDPAALKGSKRVLFASAYSHSGFKAPLMILYKDFGLLPERDYTPRFVSGQESAIKEIAAGRGDAAPVASDLLRRILSQDEIPAESIRSIYKSVSYPPACFAYAHQLKPELADKIKAAFLEYDWQGSSLEKAYSPANQSRFVAASYKDDWAAVREVEAEVMSVLVPGGSAN